MLGYPNLIDSATLAGGSWLSSLPVTNLQTREMGEKAQSVDLQVANTQLTINLGSQTAVQLFAAAAHNFSINAQYRLRSFSDAGFTVNTSDTGVTDVWPVVYPYGTLPWEHPSWFGGKYAASEIAGYNATLIVPLAITQLSQYWKFEIFDTTNAAGYVQFGRIFIGPGWQPSKNMSWGQSLGWETKTEVQETESGSEVFKVMTPYRVEKYRLDSLTRDEAMANLFEIQRRAGVDKEILWLENPYDTVHAIRTQFLARMRVLSPVEYPYFSNNSAAVELKELI